MPGKTPKPSRTASAGTSTWPSPFTATSLPASLQPTAYSLLRATFRISKTACPCVWLIIEDHPQKITRIAPVSTANPTKDAKLFNAKMGNFNHGLFTFQDTSMGCVSGQAARFQVHFEHPAVAFAGRHS
jgi:hypothetical protein